MCYQPDKMKKAAFWQPFFILWERLESNQRHKDFQSFALPTELHSLRFGRAKV